MLNMDEYNVTEEFIVPGKAVRLSYLITFTFAAVYIAAYIFLRFIAHETPARNAMENIGNTVLQWTFLLYFFIVMFFAFLFMVAGLLIKAALTASHCDNKWHDLKFKIVRCLEKPYCTAIVPVKIKHYIKGVLAYILTVAIVPYIIAFIVGDFMFILAACITVLWASADILLLLRLIKHVRKDGGEYIVDNDCVLLYKIYSKK